MKNVTVTLDEEVAHWARVQAAQRNTSVSRLLGELLRELMAQEQGYQRAMRDYLSRKPRVLSRARGDVSRVTSRPPPASLTRGP